MKLFEKLNSAFPAPVITRRRIFLAMTVAVVADGLQFLLLPFEWTFLESVVDIVAMALTMRIIGFHLLLLPTFIIEFIPFVDVIPTWTACVAAVIALRRHEQNRPPPPPAAPPARPVIEI